MIRAAIIKILNQHRLLEVDCIVWPPGVDVKIVRVDGNYAFDSSAGGYTAVLEEDDLLIESVDKTKKSFKYVDDNTISYVLVTKTNSAR